MSDAKVLLRSFAGGEITPELYGRVDLVKNQTGLQRCRNAWTLPHGPVQNRPGFRYVLEAKHADKPCVVIPFQFNTQQTYRLEFGDRYLRFHTQGGTLVEASRSITAMTAAAPAVFTAAAHGYTVGQWVFLSGLVEPADFNNSYYKIATVPSSDTFTLSRLDGTSISGLGLPVSLGAAAVARVYEIVTPYDVAVCSLAELHYTQSADVMTLTIPQYPVQELKRLGATNWTLTPASFVPVLGVPGSVSATATVATGTGFTAQSYVVTAVADAGLEESLPSTPASCSNNLSTAGNKNTVTWAAVTGAVRYSVYKARSGLYGYIGQTDQLSFEDDNIFPTMTVTPPVSANPFNAVNEYPATVAYFEQRRCFGGSVNRPQNFWATRSGTESNLGSSIPVRDNDAIAFRIAAREVNRIRHLVPLADLIALTSGGVWRIYAQNSDALTALTAAARPQSYDGASAVQPAVTSSSLLYSQDRGSHIREVRYNFDSQGYVAPDVSIMAPHLFDGYTIVSMAYQRTPVQILWCVRSDGVLLGLTYQPEHDVYGWHRHDTDGFVESVAVTAEGVEDVLAAVIKRTVNGRTTRYIEELYSRRNATLATAFHVDSGIVYSGPSTSTVRGLWHLEGKTVSILANGAVMPRRTVVNGQVALQAPSTYVVVGLPYVSQVQTLPLTVEGAPASGHGTQKAIDEVIVRVTATPALKMGPTFDKLTEDKRRTTEPYGNPPEPATGERRMTFSPTWSFGGEVCIEMSDPLPFTVNSMALKVSGGD